MWDSVGIELSCGLDANGKAVVQDIYPAIHLTDSDFAVITQAAYPTAHEDLSPHLSLAFCANRESKNRHQHGQSKPIQIYCSNVLKCVQIYH